MQTKIVSLLQELEKTSHKYWNISRKAGIFLNLFIQNRRYQKIFEIGTSNGYSGIWIAEALSHTGGTLYTIESHAKKRFHLAKANFQKAGLTKNIVQILGHAPEDIPKIPKSFDMVFFDATKEEHLQYFQSLKNRIKKGGVIITDNVISHKKELSSYIKAIRNESNWTSVELNIGSGMMISQKIS